MHKLIDWIRFYGVSAISGVYVVKRNELLTGYNTDLLFNRSRNCDADLLFNLCLIVFPSNRVEPSIIVDVTKCMELVIVAYLVRAEKAYK